MEELRFRVSDDKMAAKNNLLAAKLNAPNLGNLSLGRADRLGCLAAPSFSVPRVHVHVPVSYVVY